MSARKSAAAQTIAATTEPGPSGLTPDQALALLREGNRRYVAGKAPLRDKNASRRLELAQSQAPFATIMCCSDSRVPPELLFGRGLGELFVVRTAGHVVDTAGMGSIEYAVSALGCPLIVVLGHQRCGAVAAAVSLVEQGKSYPGSIGQMIQTIVPAVLSARRAGTDDLVERSIRKNVDQVAERLRLASEPMMLEPIEAGRLKVVGAVYSLEQGEVAFF